MSRCGDDEGEGTGEYEYEASNGRDVEADV